MKQTTIKQFTFISETEANKWLLSDEAKQYNNHDTCFHTLSNGNVVIEFVVVL
jgi:hypothetical protein